MNQIVSRNGNQDLGIQKLFVGKQSNVFIGTAFGKNLSSATTKLTIKYKKGFLWTDE